MAIIYAFHALKQQNNTSQAQNKSDASAPHLASLAPRTACGRAVARELGQEPAAAVLKRAGGRVDGHRQDLLRLPAEDRQDLAERNGRRDSTLSRLQLGMRT